MTPEEFIISGASSPDDLIGMAGKVSRVQVRKASKNTAGTPIKLLLYGEPGCGKSETAKCISEALSPVGQRNRLSGQHLTADDIRSWIEDTKYSQQSWIIWVIEEVDSLSKAAQTLILQYMDQMGPFHALICTSNCDLDHLSDRFQSRFQTIEVKRPQAEEVANFISGRWAIDYDMAFEIAEANYCDVRASLNDAQMELDMQEYGEASA
ncbi:ATP-binding protein [Cerasicoccus frondis]|uniref:ATP-binding protein n=1 Tax=Cerasicoccus frondis TaxID=490090 RepID=UPI0028529BB9|nr:ATP-binding protein [Cerasicoccus frondis]